MGVCVKVGRGMCRSVGKQRAINIKENDNTVT